MCWLSSFLHWIWKNHFDWKIVREGTLIFSAILVFVFAFGLGRLLFQDFNANRLLTASIVQQRGLNDSISSCHWTDAREVGRFGDDIEKNLLSNSEIAAKAGAKIILWQESAGFIPMTRERLFVERARSLAADYKIYLLMTLWSIPENFPVRRVENKLLVIDTLGQIETIYIKNFPVAIEPIIRGKGEMPAIHTNYGIIAPAICADADYPRFIRQSSTQKVDVMFVPANDWRAIDPLHAHMAVARAIENGFSLVRPAGQGLSVATDSRGRVLSSLDYYKSNDQIMYAAVPFSHSSTLYGWAGDYFPIVGMVCLVVMISLGFFKKKDQNLHPFTLGKDYSTGM
jgi:apolipoprotein N-acyltransferase